MDLQLPSSDDALHLRLQWVQSLTLQDVRERAAKLGLFQRPPSEQDRWLHEVFIPYRLQPNVMLPAQRAEQKRIAAMKTAPNDNPAHADRWFRAFQADDCYPQAA